MKITFDIEMVDTLSNNAIARVYYPTDVPDKKIQIIKNLNAIELSNAIYHEIGHIFDWYLGMSKDEEIREKNATIIGESLRFRKSSDTPFEN